MKNLKTYILTVSSPLEYVPDGFVKKVSHFLKRKPESMEQDLVSKIVRFKYHYLKSANEAKEALVSQNLDSHLIATVEQV